MQHQAQHLAVFLCAMMTGLQAAEPNTSAPSHGLASWYGEELRGRPMANGEPFDPGQLTAASWFYPLGTELRVSLQFTDKSRRSVVVRVTDRGPSRELVKRGRIIDLSHAAFVRLAPPETGLVAVRIKLVEQKGFELAAIK